MKNKDITINVFEENDYVITPNGYGIITEVLCYASNTGDLFYRVKVQHKEGYSKNPSNEVVDMDGTTPILITKNEYDEE